MTATNICYNFVGFRYSPPLNSVADITIVSGNLFLKVVMVEMLKKYNLDDAD